MGASKRIGGRVCWYNRAKGFGAIQRDDDGQAITVIAEWRGEKVIPTLQPDDRVTFAVETLPEWGGLFSNTVHTVAIRVKKT